MRTFDELAREAATWPRCACGELIYDATSDRCGRCANEAAQWVLEMRRWRREVLEGVVADLRARYE